MKKVFSIVILFALLIFIYQVCVGFFKNGHHSTYTLTIGEEEFKIDELFEKKGKGHYSFQIDYKKNHFSFESSYDYNKQKKVIEDIRYVEKEGMTCIYPVYIQKKNSSNIFCNRNGQNLSYTAVKGEPLVKEFVDLLKKSGFSSPSWEEPKDIVSKQGLVEYYRDQLLKEDYITVWDYRGLHTISVDKMSYSSFFDYDRYENTHGKLVGNYFLIPNYMNNQLFEFDEYYSYNILNREKSKIALDTTLSNQTYINGIVDDKLYVFDKNNLLQYEISPKKKERRLIGNTKINAQFYNGKWQDRNIYDFSQEKLTFQVDYSKIEELKKYSDREIFETERSYYLYDSEGRFYQFLKKDMGHPIFLFQQRDVKNIQAFDDTIYFLIADTLYYYQENHGIQKIVKYAEFKFNTENMYGVYKKS